MASPVSPVKADQSTTIPANTPRAPNLSAMAPAGA
jgi:hypothetical protein